MVVFSYSRKMVVFWNFVTGYNLAGRTGPSGTTKAIDFSDNYMMVLVNYPTSVNYPTPTSVIKVFDHRKWDGKEMSITFIFKCVGCV